MGSEKLLEYGVHGLCLALIILVGMVVKLGAEERSKRSAFEEKRMDLDRDIVREFSELSTLIRSRYER